MIGTSIGPYRVLDLLGSDRTGEVYLAENRRQTAGDSLSSGRDFHRAEAERVALKALRPELVGEPTRIARLKKHARAAAALRHPGICALHDITTHEDRLFLVMELLAGTRLPRFVNGNPLPIEQLLSIGTQVANGLDAAHECGVVHGDLHSTDVFVTDDGDAKILGFGLAALANQAAAENEPDAGSDARALGAILYEMATGRSPFAGAHDSAVSYGPPRAIEANSRLPTGLVRLIDAALQRDPAEGVASVDEIKRQLEEIRRAPGSLDSILPAEHVSSTAAVEPPPRPDHPNADADPLVQPRLPLDAS